MAGQAIVTGGDDAPKIAPISILGVEVGGTLDSQKFKDLTTRMRGRELTSAADRMAGYREYVLEDDRYAYMFLFKTKHHKDGSSTHRFDSVMIRAHEVED